MTTILDALKNAQINFDNLAKQTFLDQKPFYIIAKSQLDNAIEAIEKGGKLEDDISEYIEDVF